MYWNQRSGTVVPLDAALGCDRYSLGVQEICSRVGTAVSFRRAAEDIGRTAQLSVSAETVRRVVENRAALALEAQRQGALRPAWTSADCRVDLQSPTCLITGLLIGMQFLSPLDKAGAGLFRQWLWESRGLDLLVQGGLIFAGALGVAALLPRGKEEDE